MFGSESHICRFHSYSHETLSSKQGVMHNEVGRATRGSRYELMEAAFNIHRQSKPQAFSTLLAYLFLGHLVHDDSTLASINACNRQAQLALNHSILAHASSHIPTSPYFLRPYTLGTGTVTTSTHPLLKSLNSMPSIIAVPKPNVFVGSSLGSVLH